MITRTICKTRSLYLNKITEYLSRLDKTLGRINSNPHITVKATTVKIKAKNENLETIINNSFNFPYDFNIISLYTKVIIYCKIC